jgi:hypothetical protein
MAEHARFTADTRIRPYCWLYGAGTPQEVFAALHQTNQQDLASAA